MKKNTIFHLIKRVRCRTTIAQSYIRSNTSALSAELTGRFDDGVEPDLQNSDKICDLSMVMADRYVEDIRNGRRYRNASPNGYSEDSSDDEERGQFAYHCC